MPLESSRPARVAVIMGSDSDYPVMKEAVAALNYLEIAHEVAIISAHRTPQEMMQFAQNARGRGIRVIIAGAGGAAHLPGMVAAVTELPVIGVPVPIGHLQGVDALHSIVQMPKGVPVATVAIGNAWNAGVLAAQILGAALSQNELDLSPPILDRVKNYKTSLREMVLAKKL